MSNGSSAVPSALPAPGDDGGGDDGGGDDGGGDGGGGDDGGGDGGGGDDGGGGTGPVRLELVLDLDHTCVHAVEMPLGALETPTTVPRNVHAFTLSHTNLDPRPGAPAKVRSSYKVRVREGLRAFLKEVHTFCTLHVYTMGKKSYTRAVMRIIDPQNAFDGITLCRKDEEDQHFSKSIEHLVPGTDAASVRRRASMIVLDDREVAWEAESRPHVLQISPFRCWQDDGKPMPGRPDADGSLLDMLTVLRGVRDDLASGRAQSVPHALDHRRRHVLAGCVVIFSGGILRDSNRTDQCVPWCLAEAFGAKCEKFFSAQVTHVVSPNVDTNSVKKAITKGLHAVTPQWLYESCTRWHRQAEAPYSLDASVVSQAVVPKPPRTLEADDQALVARVTDLAASLTPPGMHNNKRLAVAILYLVPSQTKVRAGQSLERWRAAQESNDPIETRAALIQLCEVVGKQRLQLLLSQPTFDA